MNQDATLAGPWVFAVADGMGGHAAGELASSLTVAALAEATDHDVASAEQVEAAIGLANRRILHTVAERPGTEGMGATLAVVAICLEPDGRECVLVANVGDARVYRFREAQLLQLSTDHSVVQELITSGQLTPEEATGHRHRHEVTRALGLTADVEATTSRHEVVVGDRYIVCSDGLSDTLDLPSLTAWCGTDRSAPEVARDLIAAALEAGARDNVSAVVLDVTAVPVIGPEQRHLDATETTVPVAPTAPQEPT